MVEEVNHKRICTICGSLHNYREHTCSDECHKLFLDRVEQEVGKEKIIVDAATGKEHVVPTKEILENGLKQENLKNYPVRE